MTDPSISRLITHQRRPHSFVSTRDAPRVLVAPLSRSAGEIEYRFSKSHGTGSVVWSAPDFIAAGLRTNTRRLWRRSGRILVLARPSIPCLSGRRPRYCLGAAAERL